jgi:hypothetical protein
MHSTDLQSRTRTRPTTSGPTSTAPLGIADADPDFLALTARQQRLIDKTFDRATRPATKSRSQHPRKKRRLTPPIDDDMGGFMDDGEGEGGFMDAGGFLPEDVDDAAGGGGFMPDEEEDGGFLPDEDEPEAEVAHKGEDGEPRRIPLRSLPAILSSLNLPSDEDVLAVFRSSASGWTEPDRWNKGKEEVEEAVMIGGGVELKDFRAVCAALMGPDEGEEGGDIEDGDASASDDEEGDVYRQGKEGEDSSLSEITEDEYQQPTSAKGKGKGKSQTSRGRRGKGKKDNLEETGPVKLNSRQREVVNDLWGMLKPESAKEVRGGHILGRDEVRNKARDLGEMWTEDEVSQAES